jgi:hypothetical protein
MEEKMMGNDMDKSALQDEKMMIDKAMGLAKQMDDMEEGRQIRGEFSKNGLNRLVDALNQANRVFKAPTYPRFEAAVDVLPPEFIRNLEMVAAAARDAGLDDYMFDLEGIEDDKDLKIIAGIIDSAAMDKSFKAFLNKPQGMGDIQDEAGVPVMETEGGDMMSKASEPVVEEDEEELFMARMRA